MNLQPSDEQVMLRDMVRRFLADRLDGTTMAKGPMPPDDWRALGDLGLFAFLLPERAGGMGGGAAEVMIIAEEFGRALAITPLAGSVVLCGQLIAHGEPASLWSGPLASGEAVLAFGTGVSVDRDRVSGEVGIVTDAMAASAFVVAYDGGGVGVVEANAPGVERRPVRLVDGSFGADVRFAGSPATTLDITNYDLQAAVTLAELAVVSELVGAMGSLLESTTDYVRQRKQFGKAIGSFQSVQHRCARLYMLLEQSRSMVLKGALCDEGKRQRAVTAAKAYVFDAAQRLAEDAVHLHGGMGVTDELAVARGLRRVVLLSHLFGGSAAARRDLAA